MTSPWLANSFSQKARAKKPRSSPRFSRSIRYAPASGCLGEDHGFPVSTEEVESTLERAEADETVTLEVLLAEAVFNHLAMEFLHPGRQVVLELEIRKELVQEIKVNSIVAWVCADLARVDDLGRGDQTAALGHPRREPGSSRRWHRR